MNKIRFKKILGFILLFYSITIIKIDMAFAYSYGDQSGTPSWSGAAGCHPNSSICWTNLSNDVRYPVYGVRVSIVDGYGNMVSNRYVDYVGEASDAEILNSSKGYYRCNNTNGNRLSYMSGAAQCDWSVNNGNNTVYYLSWLPNIYATTGASEQIRNTLLNLSRNELQSTFFDRLGYTPKPENVEKHYLIIEPITYIQFKGNNYYGSFYEFFKLTFRSYNTNDWVMTNQFMPLSIYSTGNTDIKGPGGYNSATRTYFNGKLKVADTTCNLSACPEITMNTNWEATGIKTHVLVNLNNSTNNPAYGIGIYWLNLFPNVKQQICEFNNKAHFADSTSGPNGENCCEYVKNNLSKYGLNNVNELYNKYPQCRSTCDYNNSSHFATKTSGPNGENCCEYVKDNLSKYGLNNVNELYNKYPQCRSTCDYNNSSHFANETSGPNGENCCQYVLDNSSKYNVTKSNLFSKYPQCRASILDKCNFDLTTQYPSCGENAIGIVKDIEDWDCIYASAYSNDTAIKNYFLKYGSTTSSCSVYCRDELSYMYPSAKMNVLAGNYFTIGNTISSFYSYIDANNTLKVKAASLGPIQSTITRECKILGTANNACINAANIQLNNISAPSIDFAYESKYYNNPTVSLASSRTSTTTTGYKRTNTYSYSLPTNTYKYVSKDGGTSYKNVSEVGNTEYIEIENHLPIHFSKNDYTADYQITITKFNLPNFDKLILKGQAVSVKFSSSIETYIKTLIDAGYTRPINIGGTYYFDPAFIKHLNNKGYSINNILQMTCGNTNNYSCTNDYNGVVCYDKNTYSNSEQTYALFNACINNEVQKIVSEKVSYKNDMLYECSFNVVRNIKDVCDPNNENCDSGNPNGNPDGGGSDGGLLNVIYRPISLDNPFPSIDADGRVTGANWCYGDNCSNTNPIVEKVITNNRDVTTEEVYRELDPLYTITLTPGLIKEIREYNDKNDYDDFTLDCNNNGTNCKSTFIREKFQNYFSGCGIKNKSGGLRCQEYDKW